jgi:hypothetical protein
LSQKTAIKNRGENLLRRHARSKRSEKATSFCFTFPMPVLFAAPTPAFGELGFGVGK